MTEIKGVQNKVFKFTLEWIIPAEYVFDECIEDYLDKLREIGDVVVTNVDLIDKEGK